MSPLKPLAQMIVVQGLMDAHVGSDRRGSTYQQWDIPFWSRLANLPTVEVQWLVAELRQLQLRPEFRKKRHDRLRENVKYEAAFIRDCRKLIVCRRMSS